MDPLDIAGLGVDAFKLGYNIYTNKRDFDYQKALQQTMFEREDTAVQRRMADLKAAGLNPSLSNGSAAGAGAVVSRSNTNDLGSALDTVQAINSVKQQKQAVENAKIEGEILRDKANQEAVNASVQRMDLLNYLGLPYSVELKNNNGKLEVGFGVDWTDERGKSWAMKEDTPLYNLFNYNMQNQRNSADLLQKELNWYTVGQLANVISSGIGSVSGAVNAGSNAYRAANTIKRFR